MADFRHKEFFFIRFILNAQSIQIDRCPSSQYRTTNVAIENTEKFMKNHFKDLNWYEILSSLFDCFSDICFSNTFSILRRQPSVERVEKYLQLYLAS